MRRGVERRVLVGCLALGSICFGKRVGARKNRGLRRDGRITRLLES